MSSNFWSNTNFRGATICNGINYKDSFLTDWDVRDAVTEQIYAAIQHNRAKVI